MHHVDAINYDKQAVEWRAATVHHGITSLAPNSSAGLFSQQTFGRVPVKTSTGVNDKVHDRRIQVSCFSFRVLLRQTHSHRGSRLTEILK